MSVESARKRSVETVAVSSNTDGGVGVEDSAAAAAQDGGGDGVDVCVGDVVGSWGQAHLVRAHQQLFPGSHILKSVRVDRTSQPATYKGKSCMNNRSLIRNKASENALCCMVTLH